MSRRGGVSREGADGVDVPARQDPLREEYRSHPGKARITDSARTRRSTALDPFHGVVEATSQDLTVPYPFGIHRAVGGDHDLQTLRGGVDVGTTTTVIGG